MELKIEMLAEMKQLRERFCMCGIVGESLIGDDLTEMAVS